MVPCTDWSHVSQRIKQDALESERALGLQGLMASMEHRTMNVPAYHTPAEQSSVSWVPGSKFKVASKKNHEGSINRQKLKKDKNKQTES